jgi:hypothetical protein|tara:strand:+ start:170 stop:451 length:282 start_codon:yes stop_codon:yes gene_type:complete
MFRSLGLCLLVEENGALLRRVSNQHLNPYPGESMSEYVPITAALKILSMARSQRLEPGRRERIDKAIEDLTRALHDPEFRASIQHKEKQDEQS